MMKNFDFKPVLEKAKLTVTEFANQSAISRATAHTWIKAKRVPEKELMRLQAQHPEWFK